MPAWAAIVPAVLWALDKFTEGSVSGGQAIDKAVVNMGDSMNRASSTIDSATKQALALNAPYMNPEVFKKMSELVQSGAFQKPFGKSFQANNWQTPGMNFNPTRGKFGMTPWQAPRTASFTPQGLPSGMTGVAQPFAPMPPPQIAPPTQQLPPSTPEAFQKQTMLEAIKAALDKGRNIAPIQMPPIPGIQNSPTMPSLNVPSLNVPRPTPTIPKIGSGPTMPTMPGPQMPTMPGPRMPSMPGPVMPSLNVPTPTPTMPKPGTQDWRSFLPLMMPTPFKQGTGKTAIYGSNPMGRK